MKFKDPSQTTSKDVLRMKGGETVKGVFRGDPYEFRLHWSANQSSVCPETDSCQLCATQKSKFRFRLNFVTRGEDGVTYVAKIFEGGWNLYQSLNALNKDYELEKNVVRISRQGTTKNDTTYSIIPVPNSLLSAELEHTLSLVKLHDFPKSNGPDGMAAAPREEGSGMPFDDGVPF